MGILSNAEKWLLVQYDHSKDILKSSKVFEVFLPARAKDKELEATVLPILLVLSAILKEQADLWETVEL